MYRLSAISFAVLAVAISCVGFASAETLYTINEVLPPDYTGSMVFLHELYDNSLLAVTTTAPSTKGFIKRGDDWTNLGSLDATYTTTNARGINSSGYVVGFSNVSSSKNHAFVWNPNTETMQDIHAWGATPTSKNSWAVAINSTGVVVGYSEQATVSTQHAFSWTQTGGMVDLGTLGGSSTSYQSRAYDINDNGQITGDSKGETDYTGYLRAFRYSGGTMSPLGTLGGYNSSGWAINSLGHVVGFAQNASGIYHGFLWTETGGMNDLGYLEGGTDYSSARDISDNGIIVGELKDASNNPIAGVYLGTPGDGGKWYDLNTMIDPDSGWVLQYAKCVNNAGEIMGYGTYTTGGVTYTRAFLLSPIPEPSTLALLACGLLGLLAYAWRKWK